MKTTKVNCDYCDKDITGTTNCEGWRLCLKNEPLTRLSELVTDMCMPQELSRDYHFCGIECHRLWVMKTCLSPENFKSLLETFKSEKSSVQFHEFKGDGLYENVKTIPETFTR